MVDSKKIAKNTMMLYIRMLLILAVSLYTSRVILQVLGVDDYGVYHLIAGFVTFLSFISNALVSAMQRFFNVSLGKRDLEHYKEVFSMSINILLLFSILIIVVGETVGLWFVYTQLNIPAERVNAAHCVYQISLLSFVANTLRTPFHASIIAHERMSFYAYISIFEVLLRLGIVFLLWVIPFDHLILYSILYLFLIVLVDLLFLLYCNRQFRECRYRYSWNKSLFSELLSFSGWSLLGQSAIIAKNQGESILVNRFFSVAANAALGIAVQVTSAIDMFVSNFQTAFKPQLIQTYAANEKQEHFKLLFRACKYSYFLLLVLFLPIVFNIDLILSLWLVQVPEYSNYFIVFILISYLIRTLGTPLTTSIISTGKIKNYELSHTIIYILSIILIFFVLKAGYPPYSVSVVAIGIQLAMLFIRLYFSHSLVGVSYKQYLKKCVATCSFVTVMSFIIPICCLGYSFPMGYRIIITLLELFITLLSIFVFGISRSERTILKYFINKKLHLIKV